MFNINNKQNYEMDYKALNYIRGLSIDMIDNAKSGHPGICLGATSIIYTLFKRHMNIYLDDDKFVNRDRFILSAGHGVPLLYSLLYMLDKLELDDLKKLRNLNSKTPGHPELNQTPFVEATTGPLGEGIATSVGMALSERYLNNITNGLINHYTYVLCGDGELEEGITYEALTLAGTLKLNKLIVLCDLNGITLDNTLKASTNEDIKKRFESINFNVIEVNDLPENIDEAILNAKKSDLPSIIIVKTIIGKYSKLENTNLVHGKPLDEEDIFNIKEKLEIYQTKFNMSDDVMFDFKETIKKRGEEYYKEWNKLYQKEKNKDVIDKLINNDLSIDLSDLEVEYNNKSLRDLSGDILNKIALKTPLFLGGSADLSSSCKTKLVDFSDFSFNNYKGRNINFGIRENGMAAILNGMALSGLYPFGSTFLVFSDYMRPSIRMSALMNLNVLYIFTHDSIIVGEDGPTHQPIEQLSSLNLIPNLQVYHPYDLNELIGCYQDIFTKKLPSCLILPRDNKNISNLTKKSGVFTGMYIVLENKTDDYVNLLTSGETLGIVLEVSEYLTNIGIDSRVISVPCLKNINEETKEKLLNKKTIGITLGDKNLFYGLTNEVIGINEFGKSGSKEELLDFFQFTSEKLQSKILEILNK